jgi:hypothetical protein
MTWNSFHRRGEILRTVTEVADARRDGVLPMDVPGVAETFGDELTLLGALQLRWHTRLAGRIERELMNQPLDLEGAVVTAWQATAAELPGILAVVDRHRAAPLDDAMADAMTKSAAKERTMLAVMAGLSSGQDSAAIRVGARIEERARATHRPTSASEEANHGLFERIKAALAA